jgi:hypothetical protein
MKPEKFDKHQDIVNLYFERVNDLQLRFRQKICAPRT